jgi:hypothetical protein
LSETCLENAAVVPAIPDAVKRGWLAPAFIGSAPLLQILNATVLSNALPRDAGDEMNGRSSAPGASA